jgi:glutamyl-tRNA reductase
MYSNAFNCAAAVEALGKKDQIKIVGFDALPEALAQADIIICSTGAPHIVLHAGAVREALQARAAAAILGSTPADGSGSAIPAEMLVVDLAVPRDADPAIAGLPGVRLVDIDGLEIEAQRHSPLDAEVRSCVEAIVEAETQTFAAWLAGRSKAGLIRRLQTKADRICAEQVEKTARRLGSPDAPDRQALEAMACAITAQLLHAPIDYLKNGAGEECEFARIFRLD